MIGCILWYFLSLNVIAFTFWAELPGFFAGLLAVKLGKQTSEKLGMTTALLTAALTIGMQFVVLNAHDDRKLSILTEEVVQKKIAFARDAEAAKTDADLKDVMSRDPELGISKGEIDEATLARYRKEKLPALIKLAKGEPSRAKLSETTRATLAEEEDNHYRRSWLWMGLFIFFGISTSFKMASGGKK